MMQLNYEKRKVNIINFENIFEKVKDYDILLVAYEEEKERFKDLRTKLKINGIINYTPPYQKCQLIFEMFYF